MRFMRSFKWSLWVFALAMSASADEQPLTKVEQLQGGSQLKLNDRTIYRVPEGMTVNVYNGMSIQGGQTAAIYIPEGSALKVTTYGSQPGIALPGNAKLIVFGAGRLEATGGNGASGSSGGGGNSAYCADRSMSANWWAAGCGGWGGSGGAGAGAGIGGGGGKGGEYGKYGDSPDYLIHNIGAVHSHCDNPGGGWL